MATPGIAASAYAKLANMSNPGATLGKTIGDSKDSGVPSFGALLKDVVNAVAESGRKSDALTTASVAGKASMVDVVTAVAETETAIGALVSVRDKVIASYQEIMRMTI
jgi:flagellar hook-basal body complex protein FliE